MRAVLDKKICPRCAETVKAAANVCKHCGAEFSTDRVAQSVAHSRRSRRLVSALVAGLFLLWLGNFTFRVNAAMSLAEAECRAAGGFDCSHAFEQKVERGEGPSLLP